MSFRRGVAWALENQTSADRRAGAAPVDGRCFIIDNFLMDDSVAS